MNELKFEPIINGKFVSQIELENRNERAIVYSRKCKKKSGKNRILTGIVSCSLVTVMFIGMFFAWLNEPVEIGYYAANPDKTLPIHYIWVEPENESEITCDVLKSEANTTD